MPISKNHLIKILAITLAMKAIYLISFYAFDKATGNTIDRFSFDGICQTYKQADSYWYQKIAENGYRTIPTGQLGYSNAENYLQTEWAFFPMYPMLIKALMLTSLSFDASALIISLLFSFLAFSIFYLFVKDTFNEKVAILSTIILIVFPFNYYFSMFYSESIFLFFILFCFWSVKNKKYFLLSIGYVFLCLLRPNGIIIALPLYIFLLEQLNSLSWKNFFLGLTKKNTLYFYPGIICFIIWCCYQYHKTGNYFAFSEAQAGWYREFMFPLLSLFRKGNWQTQVLSYYSIVIILSCIFIYKKLPLSLNVFVWISILLPLCSGSVLSMQRFMSVAFPYYFLISQWNFIKKHPAITIFSLLSTQIFLFYLWYKNDFFSF